MAEERVERRLTAILAADIAGYSALMGADEARTVRDLKAHQAVVLPMIGEFGGRIIDTAGDGILAEFASVVNAVKCAVAVQSKMAERNTAIEPERRMQFRMGVNMGDVIYDETRIYGDGINVSARLEGIAEPGGICLSATAFEHIQDKVDVAVADLGEQQLKNNDPEPPPGTLQRYSLRAAGRGRRSRIGFRRAPVQRHAIDAHRPDDVLELLLAQIGDGDIDFVLDVLKSGG